MQQSLVTSPRLQQRKAPNTWPARTLRRLSNMQGGQLGFGPVGREVPNKDKVSFPV